MKINFRNEVQVALYKKELSGQISDGYWENSRPHNHYQRMNNAEVQVGEPLGAVDFWPLRRYNFANSLLWETCSLRMLEIARSVPGYEKITFKQLKRELRDMSKIVNAKQLRSR